MRHTDLSGSKSHPRLFAGPESDGPRRARRWSVAIHVVLLVASTWAVWGNHVSATPDTGEASERESYLFDLGEPSYDEVLRMYSRGGVKPSQGVDIVIPAPAYSASGGGSLRSLEIVDDSRRNAWRVEDADGARGGFLGVVQRDSWVEWKVEIPSNGLYNIEIEYFLLEGKRAPAQFELKIDGRYPFAEAKRIFFERTWRDNLRPREKPERDNQDNDLRPGQVEAPLVRRKRLVDPDGLFREPLLFHFTRGAHLISMKSISEPIALHHIRVTSPRELPPYEDVRSGYALSEVPAAKEVLVKLQAEATLLKTDPTIRREFGWDPLSEPRAGDKWRLNEFGGWRWRSANQEVSWEFSVPRDGLYNVSVKAFQGNRLPVTRSITLDGRYLFSEMQEVLFPYSRSWQLVRLGGDQDPWLFYLTKGKHVLTMTVKVGPASRTVLVLRDKLREMAELSREIVMVTGTNPDPNMEYDLDSRISDLVPRLTVMRRAFLEEAEFLQALGGTDQVGVANSLRMTASQIDSMARWPDTIPKRLEQFSSSQATLGQWLLSLQDQPLALDYILIHSPGAKLPRVRSTLGERLVQTLRNVYLSFRKDYTGVGSVYGRGRGDGVVRNEKTLTVWVARGREWTEIIKDMAEDDFTPRTGTKVNINVLPAQQTQALLLAAVAGSAPDVAMGVPQSIPVEFAIRNAVLPLNTFADFGEVAKRFRPGALIPFEYEGSVYALPENQDFTMLFYRKDILQQLGITPPQTWVDVYRILPHLALNGLDFYYASGLTPFLFQRGGDFYSEGGYRSALDSPQALRAFIDWTNLYTSYKIPVTANFYMRMRTGDIPIGVANYWMYMLLATAAPELTGWWEMVPMPGTMKPDGSIDRSMGGASDTVFILKGTKDEKAAWEFLKWWTSTDVQVRFGRELEALLGVQARWNSANVEALRSLPWPTRDIEAILEQWEWFKQEPVVLGGYFTGRHLGNAWNRVVLQGENPREALEQAVEDINRELKKKQDEFGVTVDGGGH